MKLLQFLACLLGGLTLLALVILAAKASPLAVAVALGRGAFGSKDSIANTLLQTTPLLLTGLGVGLAFKGRLFNIGAEGQFLLGAIFATWAGTCGLPAALVLPAALMAGALGGALWASLAALLKLWRGVQEVISTLLLNFVAIQLVAWLVRGPLQEAAKQFTQSGKLPLSGRLAFLWPGTQLHQGFLIALILAVLVWLYLSKTASGFALRAVGAGPEAAQSAGISVVKTTTLTFLLSGALSGLAGAIQICGVTYFLADPYSKGYGYTAIAVALLANLSPLWTVITALFFGALTAGATEVQTAGVSSVVIQVLQAVTLLTLLAYGYLKERKR